MKSGRVRAVVLGAAGIAAMLPFAPAATAAGPTIEPFNETFVDINPCTGDLHSVTFTGTFYEFDRASGIEYRIDRVVTTSSGFVGRGNEVATDERVFKVADLLKNAEGDLILASATLVWDAASGTLDIHGPGLTCLKS
ncbi:MAG TPA: hypothetical protein VFU17_05480 [Candidatus Limnocylindrales bacterium]|nr:hypothetical protein [Candidatus Limnocylindrales bacterium]